MSEENKNLNTTVDGGETPTDSADASRVVDIPINKNNAMASKESVNTGVYIHKFKKPFEYEGVKYITLNFYFDRLTGRDMIAIENEMLACNEYIVDPLLSKSLQSKVAARAGNIGADVLEALPIHEFNKITNVARNFFLSSGE